MFDTIEEETEDNIILANSDENIIIALSSIIFGLVVLCFSFKGFANVYYDFNNISESNIFAYILMFGAYMALGGSLIWHGFECLLFKSKAKIDNDHKKVIVEQKCTIKFLESVKETYLSDIKEIEIKHKTTFEGYDSWNIYFITNTGKSMHFFSSNESKTKELADKICKLINPQMSFRESEVSY